MTEDYAMVFYRDIKNVVDSAFENGELKGKIEGKIEIAKKLKRMGFSSNQIIEATGLNETDIDNL